MNQQMGQDGIKCSECDAVLEDQDQLDEHMRRDHSSTEGGEPESGSTEGGRMESGGQMTPP